MLISATVLPDLLGPRKIPVHGTRGTTGSEGCLLLYSAVGNSLIFPLGVNTERERAYYDEWDEAALRDIIQRQRKITETSKKLEMNKLYQVADNLRRLCR